MDLLLYIFLSILGLITLLISLFYKADIDVQILFNLVGFFLYIILAVTAFNLEWTVYDAGWQTQSKTEYAYVLVNLLFIVILSIHGFVIIMERGKNTIEKSAEGLIH